MTRERAKSMDQRSFWRSCKAKAAEETVSAARSFPGARQNDSVPTVPWAHLVYVGSSMPRSGSDFQDTAAITLRRRGLPVPSDRGKKGR
jgi:hypothetical protein